MSNTFKRIRIITLIALIGFSMSACDSGSDPTSGTYTSRGTDGTMYELVVYKASSRAAFTPHENDTYVLTITSSSGTLLGRSTGTVTSVAGGSSALLLTLENEGAVFYVTISGSGMTAIYGTGTGIPLNGGETVEYPDDLDPISNEGGGGGGGAETQPIDVGASGMSWTAVTDSPFSGNINSIAYGYDYGVFVAGGAGGKMAFSYNGYNWDEVSNSNSTFEGKTINSIAYGDGTFIAVGNGIIATSPNGIDWTKVDLPITKLGSTETIFTASSNIRYIVYYEGMFIADVTNSVGTSYDGENWEKQTDSLLYTTFGSGTGSSPLDISYGYGKFVAVGQEGKMVISDDYCQTWEDVSENTFPKNNTGGISGITYGRDMFVAVGAYGRMATSYNGREWTDVANSTFTNSSTSTINCITYNDGTFVAGGTGGRMAISNDGENWTEVQNSGFTGNSSNTVRSIAYGNGIFVAVGDYGRIAFSH